MRRMLGRCKWLSCYGTCYTQQVFLTTDLKALFYQEWQKYWMVLYSVEWKNSPNEYPLIDLLVMLYYWKFITRCGLHEAVMQVYASRCLPTVGIYYSMIYTRDPVSLKIILTDKTITYLQWYVKISVLKLNRPLATLNLNMYYLWDWRTLELITETWPGPHKLPQVGNTCPSPYWPGCQNSIWSHFHGRHFVPHLAKFHQFYLGEGENS